MKIIVTGKNITVSDKIQEAIDKKFEKFGKYFADDTRANIVMHPEKDKVKSYTEVIKILESDINSIKDKVSKDSLYYDEIIIILDKINELEGIKKIDKPIDLKNGLFIATEKLPNGAVIRLKKDGDKFTKFGGGTKKLNDYLTDKKVPLRKRNSIPVLAVGSEILAVFGVEVSNKVKLDENSKTIYQLI